MELKKGKRKEEKENGLHGFPKHRMFDEIFGKREK